MTPAALAPQGMPQIEAPAQGMPMGGLDVAGLAQQDPELAEMMPMIQATIDVLMTPSEPQAEPLGESLPSDIAPQRKASAKSVLPPELRDEGTRRNLAYRLQRIYTASTNGRGALEKRWNRNRAYRQNAKVRIKRAPHNGAEFFHFPVVQPRFDQRVAMIVGTIFGADSLYRIKRPGEQGTVVENENILQWFVDSGGVKAAFSDAIENTMIANLGVIRVRWVDLDEAPAKTSITGPYSGLEFQSVAPDNFFVFPANEGGIEEADWVSHRYETTLARVEENRKLGYWLDDGPVTPEGEALNRRETDLQSSDDSTGDYDDQRVWIYDGIYRGTFKNGKAKDYRVVWEEKSLQVLLVHEWKCPYRPYADLKVKREDNKYYTEGSPVNDVQTLQTLMNSLVNETVWGIQRRSHPNIYAEKGADEDTFDSVRPGEVKLLQSLQNFQSVAGGFDMTGMDLLFQMVMSAADAASKVSDTQSGAPSVDRDSTATEQTIKHQAFQLSGSADIERITPGLTVLAKLSLWLIRNNFSKWSPKYPFLGADDVRMFDGSFIVEPSVKSPEDAPMMQAEQCRLLIEMIVGLAAVQSPVVQALMTILPDLVRSIIRGTTLPNKDDLLRKLDKAEAAIYQQQAQMQAAMAQGVDPNGNPIDPDNGGGMAGDAGGMGDPAAPLGDAFDQALATVESRGSGEVPA